MNIFRITIEKTNDEVETMLFHLYPKALSFFQGLYQRDKELKFAKMECLSENFSSSTFDFDRVCMHEDFEARRAEAARIDYEMSLRQANPFICRRKKVDFDAYLAAKELVAMVESKMAR